MIDVVLGHLYDVPTYRLNEAVKRNRRRFPSDFMFQLSKKGSGIFDMVVSQFELFSVRPLCSLCLRGGKRRKTLTTETQTTQRTHRDSELGHYPLSSQFAISKKGRGGRRTLPYAFTEQGVAMLSSVLNSERAIEVNIGSAVTCHRFGLRRPDAGD